MKQTYPRSVVTNIDRLLGPDGQANYRGDVVDVEWTGKLQRGIEQATPVITAHANIAKALIDRKMGITGNFAASLKDRVEKSKQRAAASLGRVNASLDKIDTATDNADAFATELEREANEIHASLGQFTNGGPQ